MRHPRLVVGALVVAVSASVAACSTSPAARKKIRPLKEVVEVPATGGILRCLSKIAETAHGLNVSGAVVDEVHTLRLLRGLVEAIETGVGQGSSAWAVTRFVVSG